MTPREKSATSFPARTCGTVKTQLIMTAILATLVYQTEEPLVYNSSKARAARAVLLGRYAFTACNKNKMTCSRTGHDTPGICIRRREAKTRAMPNKSSWFMHLWRYVLERTDAKEEPSTARWIHSERFPLLIDEFSQRYLMLYPYQSLSHHCAMLGCDRIILTYISHDSVFRMNVKIQTEWKGR